MQPHKTTEKNPLPAVHPNRALEGVDPLKRYLGQVRQYPFLSLKEEKELAKEFREHGALEAARKLVNSHLRLVVKIAREYRTAYGNLLDLIQEGNLGLMKAVKKFDPERGVRLSSYAAWWIRSYILKHILDNFRLIKIGTTQAQRRIFFNLMKEKERIEKMGFKADTQNLARALKVAPQEVEEMEKRLLNSEISLDAPLSEESQSRRGDLIASEEKSAEEALGQKNFQNILEEKLAVFAKTLDERESKIFKERLLNEVPLTLQAIGDEYGISRERARQIEERIKKRLKEFFEKEGIQVKEHIR